MHLNRSQPGQDIDAHCNSSSAYLPIPAASSCAVCRCVQTTQAQQQQISQLTDSNPTTTAQGEQLRAAGAGLI